MAVGIPADGPICKHKMTSRVWTGFTDEDIINLQKGNGTQNAKGSQMCKVIALPLRKGVMIKNQEGHWIKRPLNDIVVLRKLKIVFIS